MRESSTWFPFPKICKHQTYCRTAVWSRDRLMRCEIPAGSLPLRANPLCVTTIWRGLCWRHLLYRHAPIGNRHYDDFRSDTYPSLFILVTYIKGHRYEPYDMTWSFVTSPKSSRVVNNLIFIQDLPVAIFGTLEPNRQTHLLISLSRTMAVFISLPARHSNQAFTVIHCTYVRAAESPDFWTAIC
jgi:hypothetical protein